MLSELRTVLVDDEQLALSSLRRAFSSEPRIRIVGEFQDGAEAIREIPALKPHIVFLDIEMPGRNGLQVAQSIKHLEDIRIVFVTAYSEYALKAFEVHAVNYILKPYEDEQILQTIARIARSQAPPQDLTSLIKHLEDQDPERFLTRILVKDGNRSFIVQVDEIMWIQGARNYVELRTQHKTYLYRHPFEALVEKLNPRHFVRIHRSKIIHIDELALLEKPAKNQMEAITKDGVRHPVSVGYRTRLEQILSG